MSARDTHSQSRSGRKHATRTRRRRAPARPVNYGDEQFRIVSLRGNNKPNLMLDDVVEAFDWIEDGKSILTGSVTVRRPVDGKFDLHVGDELRCDVSHFGQHRWSEVWRMRITQPQYQIANGQYVFQLSDDLGRLNQSSGDFKYRRDKAHPRGWLGHDVIADIARRYHLELGSLPVFRHRIRNLTVTGVSPLHVVAEVLKRERVYEHRRFFIRWTAGKLTIVPFARSKEMLVIGPTIIDGTLTEDSTTDFATVVRAVATKSTSKGKDAAGHTKHKHSKLSLTLASKKGTRQYGYVVRKITAPDKVDSITELRNWARGRLAKMVKPKRTLTITHPGIVSLRRGDAMKLTITGADIYSNVVYVSEIHHNVQQGSYTMDVTVSFDDPYTDKRKKDTARKKGNDPRANRPKTSQHDKHSTARRGAHRTAGAPR